MQKIIGRFSAAMFALTTLPAYAQGAGNPATGAKLYLQCRACHTVAANGAHTVGPNLYAIVGQKAGTRADYSYSPALAKSGLVWTPAALDKFLTRPTASIPGTKMAFAGIANPKARADVIAYLVTLKGGKR